MWPFKVLLLLVIASYGKADEENEEPILYYYGMEESERELPLCEPRQACSALLERHWRAPALLRLCRCARRARCDSRSPAHNNYTIPINNHATFQFCQPITDWPECSINDVPLKIETTPYPIDSMNPDKLESMHHRNINLTPPKITFKCRCREPNYWKLVSSSDSEDFQTYKCSYMLPCKTDDFCGNVSNDLYALYQSCLCPKHHICAHDGGVAHLSVSEMLYKGKGWKAYCRLISDDYSYED